MSENIRIICQKSVPKDIELTKSTDLFRSPASVNIQIFFTESQRTHRIVPKGFGSFGSAGNSQGPVCVQVLQHSRATCNTVLIW